MYLLILRKHKLLIVFSAAPDDIISNKEDPIQTMVKEI